MSARSSLVKCFSNAASRSPVVVPPHSELVLHVAPALEFMESPSFHPSQSVAEQLWRWPTIWSRVRQDMSLLPRAYSRNNHT